MSPLYLFYTSKKADIKSYYVEIQKLSNDMLLVGVPHQLTL